MVDNIVYTLVELMTMSIPHKLDRAEIIQSSSMLASAVRGRDERQTLIKDFPH
jgi:hypothetical protein